MQYQKTKPSTALQNYIRGFFILESDQYLSKPFIIKSSATFAFAMVFNYGTPHRLSNELHQEKTLPAAFISGLSISPYQLSYQGKVGMLGVIFKDTSFQELFPVPPLHSWVDDRYDLYHILGHETIIIIEQLAEAESNAARIQLMEQWLMQRIKKLQPKTLLMDRAICIIAGHRGMLKMDDLAGTIGLSPRQLRRKFKDRVGVNPKAYARLKRFSYINQRLSRDAQLPWHFFLNQGFYDQSHMIKEYREFSGENPTLLLETMRHLYRQLVLQPLPE